MQLGCSQLDITPNLPINLGGYGGRKEPAKGIETALYARSFVLKDKGLTLGLITADLIMLNRKQVEIIRHEAQRLTGIPAGNIIVSCSHTHSGPSTFGFPGLANPPDPVYIEWLLKALAGTLQMAQADLEPVKLGHARTQVRGLGANRRDPALESETQLTVLGFETKAQELKALIFNFPCHPTVLGASNLKVSSEYPGAAISTVRRIYPKTQVAFLNGACGDISTRFSRREQSHQEVKRLGKILAGNIIALAADLVFEPVALKAKTREIEVESKPVPSKEKIQEDLAHWQDKLKKAMTNGSPGEIRQAQTGYEGAKIQQVYAGVRDLLEQKAEINVWILGPVSIVSFPGELFLSLGQSLQEQSPFKPTIVAGYSNGHLGYIPHEEAYGQGGYEAMSSPLIPGTGEKLIQMAIEVLEEMEGEG